MDYILKRVDELSEQDGINRTIFAACPNSISVIKAALRSAKRWNSPVKFATTLNQVDIDRGYTNLNQKEFFNTIKLEADRLNVEVPVIVAVDHGGPWLKDLHTIEKWSFERSFEAVKKSFEASVSGCYDLIHVDPTIDITLPSGQLIAIETVAARTLDLIEHTENFRRKGGFPRMAYEVGTEEVHGGLADMSTFRKFLDLLQKGLSDRGLKDVWPCLVVGKVGTDLHTTTFDPNVAKELTKVAREYGSVIKGHYSDGVTNPEAYPLSGMGGANVGPEFTISEYDGLMELEKLEIQYFNSGKIARCSDIGVILYQAVVHSGRWKKWIQSGEDAANFESIRSERKEWLISTGCRYIWQNAEVLAARAQLYSNLENRGIQAEGIVLSNIECAMDKYFAAFNLKNLNDLL
ncbi:tagatose-6-phosphate kinase AgaZ [Aquipluma nitroreducens]|uniref:Tagatose-6-phosphate kinase AgaZ n=1 Tax=Aquipluma nitroreducens TaxID=2010828 RepID=A0A5K7SF45_9BACT|nr:class II D-tagatose-bisphosphate aldolase, non-catalytic subunit [Aquipluma nitroreducens]BBE20220.1 tagatose-6-phosphate kinase AgaZ [Aquipluma nitroreducens]